MVLREMRWSGHLRRELGAAIMVLAKPESARWDIGLAVAVSKAMSTRAVGKPGWAMEVCRHDVGTCLTYGRRARRVMALADTLRTLSLMATNSFGVLFL